MITITKKLDMSPHGIPQVIHVSQYDSDFSIQFKLYASVGTLTIESGTTAEIRGTKGSGTGYSASATLDTSNGTVTVAGSEQMTAVAGRNTFEIVLKKSGKVLGSANFILLVERAALDADTITDESVLKELNAIIESAETATQAAEEAEDAADRAEAAAQTLVIDPTLTLPGQPADAKATGDAIAQIVPGLSETAKTALLNCFAHVAWIDEHGQDYYDALHDALYPATGLVSISAVFTQGSAVINEGDDLNTLKQYLVVTGYYGDGVSQVITDYALSGQLTEGTSTITVSKEGKTATFTVTVSGSYWDYEWDASSGIVPVDKDGNAWQGSFVEGLFKLGVVNSELQFAEIGPIECEIEWMCPQARSTYPYFSFCHTYGNNGGSGFKLFRNSESGYLRTTISGAAADTSITVPVNTISKIKVICEANHCRADVDGNILEGNGAVNNQYLLANSIGYPTYNDVDFRIKSLKYKYL